MILCRFLLEVISETLQTPFKTFLQYFVQKRKALLSKCCSSEKKIGKTCYFKTLFRQKQGQNGPHPKSSLVFFSGNNKRSYDLSKTFFFYQNIKSFD